MRDEGRDEEERERRQRAQDRRDFDTCFRPDWDLRTVTGVADLEEIRSFLGDVLYVPHWNLPTDNEGIEQTLRESVASGQLVPMIDRDWRGLDRVYRPTPAPERWPSAGGAPPKTFHQHVMEAMGLDIAGANAYIERYNAMVQRIEAVQAAHAAKVAAIRAAEIDGLPGDGKPFEYVDDTVTGDVEELAASTSNASYAARMLGYDSQQFRKMVHTFKARNGIGPADDLQWHDNGDVYFKGEYIDNFHDYKN
jgi:hypothetical protein